LFEADQVSATEENVGFVTRYYLRRLAAARRRRHGNPRTPFVDAEGEVALLFLGMPLGGALSFAMTFSLHWLTPEEARDIPMPSKYILSGVILLFCYLFGRLWFDRKFKRYQDDPTPALQFDTERDRRIMARQKLFVLITAGIIMPWLGLVIGFWSWFRDHLFR
jgi:hypothetical protein